MYLNDRFRHLVAPVLATFCALFLASAAQAKRPPGGKPSGFAGVESPRKAALRRHAPVDGQLELGVYGGVMVPSGNHGFYGTQWRMLRPVGSVGARIGYYPLRWFGGEIEAGGFPGRTADGRYFNAFTVRGAAVLQLPYFRIVPFVLVGGGKIAVRTPDEVLGSDIDPAAQFGTGIKFRLRERVTLRVEWRGSLTPSRLAKIGLPALHNELLLGLSFAFGGKPRG